MKTTAKELATLIGATVEKRSSVRGLSCVKIDADKKEISFTDLDIRVAVKWPAITGKGACLVDGPALQKIAAQCKKALSIEVASNVVTVIADGDTFKLEPQDNIENFPLPVEVDITTTAKDVPSSMLKVGFCASTEATRYYLNGVHFYYVSDVLTAVATDGHRLAMRTCESAVKGEGLARKEGVIIPSKTVALLQKLKADSFTFAFAPLKMAVQHGDVTITSKLIDGTFPDYERVLPTIEARTPWLKPDKKEFLRLLKKRTIVNANNATLTGTLLTITGEKSLLEGTIAKTVMGEFEIRFNASYMEAILQDTESDNVVISVIDSNSPMQISSDDNLYVLMPMRF